MSCALHPLVEAASPCGRCGTSYCDDCVIVLGGQRLCAGCKSEALRDVYSGTTNEAQMRLASVGMRGVGLFLDRLILGVVTYPLGLSLQLGLRKVHFPFSQMTRVQIAMQIFFALAFYVYEAMMIKGRGQTLGKMVARVRVVAADGTPVTGRQAWLRASVRFLAMSSPPGSWRPAGLRRSTPASASCLASRTCCLPSSRRSARRCTTW